MIRIVIVLAIMQCVCVFAIYVQAERIYSIEKSLWQQVHRIGNECDMLRARVWKLEHKDDGEQE